VASTDPTIAAIADRLVAGAAVADRADGVLETAFHALLDAGIPLWRVSVAMPAIDPTFRAVSLVWRRGRGIVRESTKHGPDGDARFARSPIHALLESGGDALRCRLDGQEPDPNLTLLGELRAQGGTDYVLHLPAFTSGTAVFGVALSFATDRPGGFSEDALAAFATLRPALALAMCKFSLAQSLRDSLSIYLGPMTAARVLGGEVRRGQGRTVSAAILLTDLRGFTALADREDPLRVVAWLDEHLDALGEPVRAQGGEILKFLGDGFLAIFPVDDPDRAPCPVCESALAAARQALSGNEALNRRRAQAGLPVLKADLALHFGPLVYGNVGTGRRLDFTVIGGAVNEASRIEALCGEIGQPLLVSGAFAARCGAPLEPVGAFALRGISGQQRIWRPAD
jgi:adenylate cyclase